MLTLSGHILVTAPKGQRTETVTALQRQTYNEHRHKKVLLRNLRMREDVVEDSVHIAFVLFSEGKDTLVIVTCGNQLSTLR